MAAFGTISELLVAQAAARPREPAVLAMSGPFLDFGGLEALTRRWAEALAGSGIRPGDRVAVALPNGPEMATTFLTVTRVATAAPLNPELKEAEFAFYLDDLGARAVIVAENDSSTCSAAARAVGIPAVSLTPDLGGPAGSFSLSFPAGAVREAPAGGEEVEALPADVALVLHTSGTTARPKIVPLTHRSLCLSAFNVADTLKLTPEDRCLNIMPLFHIHGLVAALLASLQSGASIVCTPGFRAPDFFPWMQGHQPTWYTGVPTMHQGILARAGQGERARARTGLLRFVRSSSASLPPSVLRDLEEVFGVPVVEAYGMTEAAHQMTSNPLPPGIRKPGSVGPAAGPEVAVADEAGRFLAPGEVGEVVIRGSNVTEGYHRLDDQTAWFFGGGWFRTGDQGYLDPDGYLFLTGRLKEIINRGGETIAPREIDEALLEVPGVKQALAFSVPDPALGEEVAAAVILEEGVSATESELQAALQDRLSWGRLPKRILVLDEIPKGPTGKLQRIGLAEKLGLTSVRKEGGSERGGKAMGSGIVDRVAALWREVLKAEAVGLDQPFLEAGGDSVTATSLVLRVEEEFGVKVPLMTFFDAATVRRQARLIEELTAGPSAGTDSR